MLSKFSKPDLFQLLVVLQARISAIYATFIVMVFKISEKVSY